MSLSATKIRVREILEEHLGPSARSIGATDSLSGHGKTIEFVNVAMALETEFEVALSENAMEKADTIDAIARYIDDAVAAARGGKR
jgi:acyl carrier protein